jgi:hypothetical protein
MCLELQIFIDGASTTAEEEKEKDRDLLLFVSASSLISPTQVIFLI